MHLFYSLKHFCFDVVKVLYLANTDELLCNSGCMNISFLKIICNNNTNSKPITLSWGMLAKKQLWKVFETLLKREGGWLCWHPCRSVPCSCPILLVAWASFHGGGGSGLCVPGWLLQQPWYGVEGEEVWLRLIPCHCFVYESLHFGGVWQADGLGASWNISFVKRWTQFTLRRVHWCAIIMLACLLPVVSPHCIQAVQ